MFQMPTSSLMMTTILGFLSAAQAACATDKPMIAPINSAILKRILLRLSIGMLLLHLVFRLLLALRGFSLQLQDAIGYFLCPVIHRVLRVAPLERSCTLHPHAAGTLIDGLGQQRAGDRIRGLHFGFSGSHERIAASRERLSQVEHASLRDNYRDGAKSGYRGRRVHQRHPQGHNAGSRLIDKGETLGEVGLELVVEVCG